MFRTSTAYQSNKSFLKVKISLTQVSKIYAILTNRLLKISLFFNFIQKCTHNNQGLSTFSKIPESKLSKQKFDITQILFKNATLD